MSDLPEEYQEPRVSNGEKVTIRVMMPQGQEDHVDTRVAYNDADLGLTWEEGDQLAIIGYNAANTAVGKEILHLTNKSGNFASFSGNTVNGATHYDVYYPASAIDNTGAAHIDYSQQVQIGNNSTAHLKPCILLKQAGERLTTNEILLQERDIPMEMQNAIIKFDLGNLSVKRPISLKWDIKDNSDKVTSWTLSLQNVELGADKTFVGFLVIPSMNFSAKSVTVTLQDRKAKNNALSSPMNYHIAVDKQLTYQANCRYTATIKDDWNYRVFYKCNLNLNEPNTFNQKPEKTRYNGDGKESYLDFKDGNIILQKYYNNKDTWKRITTLEISGISEIADNAFSGNTQLATVILHDGIHTIGNNAFEGCSSLTKFVIPEDIVNIGKDAFLNCNAIGQLIAEPTTPPTLATGGNPLGLNGWAKISVPSTSAKKYKEAEGWKNYANRFNK